MTDRPAPAAREAAVEVLRGEAKRGREIGTLCRKDAARYFTAGLSERSATCKELARDCATRATQLEEVAAWLEGMRE